MKNKKVVEQLESLRENSESFMKGDDYPGQVWKDDIVALDVAIEAVKKQTPLNVKESKEHPFGECPNCHEDFNSELQLEYEIKYCPFCGQKLDFDLVTELEPIKVKFKLSYDYGDDRIEEMEIPATYTDDQIEEEAKEWAWNMLTLEWWKSKDESEAE